ncbi:hypothetical protein ACLMJK_005693 [Lecanora helva]
MSVLHSLQRRQSISPTCPSGGSWYACATDTRFVGCCQGTDVCSHGCSAGNLKPASFQPSDYDKLKDQECDAGSLWYTCQVTRPPFMGCCKTNPCSSGCPSGDLTAGFLSSNPAIAAVFLSSGAASSSASAVSSSTSSSLTSTSASSSVTTSSTTVSAASQTSSPAPVGTSVVVSTTPTNAPTTHKNTGAIAGGAVGGVAGLVLMVSLLAFFFRRRASQSRKQMDVSRASTWGAGKEAVAPDGNGGQAAMSEVPKHGHIATPTPSSPAPLYTPYTPELSANTTLFDTQQLGIEPHQSYELHSPVSSAPSASPPPRFPMPSPQERYSTPGNYSDGNAYRQ